jgi:hypothetical protein
MLPPRFRTASTGSYIAQRSDLCGLASQAPMRNELPQSAHALIRYHSFRYYDAFGFAVCRATSALATFTQLEKRWAASLQPTASRPLCGADTDELSCATTAADRSRYLVAALQRCAQVIAAGDERMLQRCHFHDWTSHSVAAAHSAHLHRRALLQLGNRSPQLLLLRLFLGNAALKLPTVGHRGISKLGTGQRRGRRVRDVFRATVLVEPPTVRDASIVA